MIKIFLTNSLKWCLIILISIILCFISIGVIITLFHPEPIKDEIEEALEEITRKKRKKK